MDRINSRKGPYYADEGDFASAGSSHIRLRYWSLPTFGAESHAAALSLMLKSTDHVMTPLGGLRGKCDPGAFDVPRVTQSLRT